MKKLVVGILLLVSAGYGTIINQRNLRASDSYIRDRVVRIVKGTGMCSGIKIHTDRGGSYILTAAHCRKLLNADNTANIEMEDGSKAVVPFIAEDGESDLMLLATNDTKGVRIADHVKMHDKVHTLTHGGNRPTYRTDGEILNDTETSFLVSFILTMDQAFECSGMNKLHIVEPPFAPPACIATTIDTLATAWIIPGSSGGPLLNEAGELVGITSALGPEQDYYFVRLGDMRSFLKDR